MPGAIIVFMHRYLRGARVSAAVAIAACVLAGCMSPLPLAAPPPDPDAMRRQIAQLLPPATRNREGWAVDIFAAFEALGVAPTTTNICAVLAVAGQESGFQVDPVVPGLAALARREMESRAARYGVPAVALRAAMALRSPDGRSYNERLDAVSTEKGLSDIFEDFIGSVPLGRRLFENLNPVRTAGPMQVGIAFAEQHAKTRRYPYPQAGSLRDELFTRRGGLYFGIAHLLDYAANYDDLLFRFADYNAGHYASRNAAFQNAIGKLARAPLALDGDLLRGDDPDKPGETELALRRLGLRLQLSDAAIHRDLLHGREQDFERTALYQRLFMLADSAAAVPLPRALVPQIRLQSPKITRTLTTDWFAHRVDGRYDQCMRQGNPVPRAAAAQEAAPR